MKYVRSGDKIIASLERGEEFCGTLKTLAAKEDIKFALVRAHGSCVRVTLGSYDKKSGGLRSEESSFLVWILELDKFLKKVIDI